MCADVSFDRVRRLTRAAAKAQSGLRTHSNTLMGSLVRTLKRRRQAEAASMERLCGLGPVPPPSLERVSPYFVDSITIQSRYFGVKDQGKQTGSPTARKSPRKRTCSEEPSELAERLPCGCARRPSSTTTHSETTASGPAISETPFQLLEEQFAYDPWRFLVVALLLNRTTSRQVSAILDKLFGRYPTPTVMAEADPTDIQPIIAPLGLSNKRAATLVRFSAEFVSTPWQCPCELHGVGRYASDAYHLFISQGQLAQPPKDHALAWVYHWMRDHS